MTTTQKKTPALRFPEFQGGWTSEKLGGKCIFQQGIQVDLELQEFAPREGYVKLLRIENYTQNSKDYRYISKDIAGKKSINADEVAIVRYGATAGFVSRGHDGVLANNLFKVKPNQGLINPFLYILLSNYKANRFFQSQMAGGAMPALSFGIVKELVISYPLQPEQQKIADFLSAVDERIQQLTKKKNLLEQYKKGVMQQIFSQQIRFKDEEGNDYPEWEIEPLKNAADKVKKKNKDNSMSFVLTNSATQGIVSQMEYFDNSVANKDNLMGYYIVKVGDFVYNPRISVTAPVGPIKRNNLRDGLMSPLYSVFRFRANNLDYIEYYFETDLWHEHLKSVANYGARHDRMSITNDKFMEMPISLPIVDEQEKIAKFLISVDDKINFVNTQLEQTQNFKKGLLQQMFC